MTRVLRALTGLLLLAFFPGVATAQNTVNLTGRWSASGYWCGQFIEEEIIEITHSGDSVTAVKVDAGGDTCVPTGEITWRGTFDGTSFSSVEVQLYFFIGGRTFVTGSAGLQGPDVIVVTSPYTAEIWRFQRIVAPAQITGKLLGSPGCPVGNPCDVATGNKFEQVTDYETAGPNVLGFTRYYNALANVGPPTFASSLGVNWRSNFDGGIRITSPTAVSVERPDGRVLGFSLVSGVWTTDTDVDLRLTQTGSTWTLADPGDATETYTTVSSTQAALTEITSRNGYRQSLVYDANRALIAVSDTYSRTISFTYSNGLIETLTTPDGLVVTYGYNTSGVTPGRPDRLVSVSYSTTPVSTQVYHYEQPERPFALTGITDENGQRYATWSYDAQGRAILSEHAGGAERTTIAYNADGSRTVTNALGLQTVYRFTTLQGVPKVTEITRLATNATPAATRQFTYDANGYLASATDWNGTRTTYVSDARGLPTTITEAAGTPQERTSTISYDSRFHLPTQIVRHGVTTDLTYDLQGNLLTRTETDTTTTTVPYATGDTRRTWTSSWSDGLLASVQGPRTDVTALTQFTYSNGALSTITNALGHVTRIPEHTPGGRPLTVVDPNGVTTQLTYDGRQRLLTRTVNTADGALTTRYAYDPAGNLQSVMLPDDSALTNSYDAAHRMTGVADLLGQRLAYTLDPLGNRTLLEVLDANGTVTRTQRAAFDPVGRLIQQTGGAGQLTQYGYDGNGNARAVTDPLGRVTQRAFDPLNRLTTITDPAAGITVTSYDAFDRPLSVTAPNGAVTTYTYDGFGNLIQTQSRDSGRTVYRYDLAGNLIRRNEAGTGAVVRYTFDALDRVRATRYPNAPADDVVYHYDQAAGGFGIGRLTSVDDAIGRLRRVYDERGNVLREIRIRGDVTLTTAYTYDAADRPVQLRYPSGARAVYGRDALGRVADITLRRAGSPVRSVVSGVAYQPFGPVRAFTYGNGIAETRGYDLDYRLTTLTGMGATLPVQQLAYGYDPADNVLSLLDGVEPAKNQSFGYDALDRLNAAAGAYGTFGWTYDPVGNRLTQQAGATLTTYSYAAQSNRLTRIQTGTARQIVSYTPTGNIAQFENRPAGTPNTALTYNEGGRLSQVLSGAVPVQTNGYDAFGRRILRTGTATGLSLFQYDLAGHLLEDADGQGQGRIDYIYLGDTPIATLQLSTNQLSFIHSDRLGTPQVATNTTQAVIWKATYEPFGAAQLESSLIGQNLRFPGQEFEVDAPWLHHNGFRDYVPVLGRYLQSDPIGLVAGLNTFSYVGNRPTVQTDPKGLWASQLTAWVHQRAGYLVFGADLTPDHLRVVADAHETIDASAYQSTDFAYMHAMRSPGETIQSACSKANLFIALQASKALEAKASNDAENALRYFTYALHTIQDSTSPSHAGFQVWSGEETLAEEMQHVSIEAQYPGVGSSLDKATRKAWNAYNSNNLSGFLIPCQCP